MTREAKLQTVKDLLEGKRSIEDIKEPLSIDRLTVNEIYLLLTLNQAAKNREYSQEEAACKEYYRTQSNQRPQSREEVRGYYISTDANYPTLIAGSDAIVKEWYSRLNLNIVFELKNCEPC
jgi:hypothetical protein